MWINLLISKLHSTMVLLLAQCCFLLISALQYLAFQTFPLVWTRRLGFLGGVFLFFFSCTFPVYNWGVKVGKRWWLAHVPCAPLQETAGMMSSMVQLVNAICASSVSFCTTGSSVYSSVLWWFWGLFFVLFLVWFDFFCFPASIASAVGFPSLLLLCTQLLNIILLLWGNTPIWAAWRQAASFPALQLIHSMTSMRSRAPELKLALYCPTCHGLWFLQASKNYVNGTSEKLVAFMLRQCGMSLRFADTWKGDWKVYGSVFQDLSWASPLGLSDFLKMK